MMTKVFLKTKCTGLYQETTLISLALVAETGQYLYLEFNTFDRSQSDDWLTENILPNLCLFAPKDLLSPQLEYAYSTGSSAHNMLDKPYKYFHDEGPHPVNVVENWLNKFGQIELVGDAPSFDWVLFCSLWGNALNIPDFICPAVHDINQDIARILEISNYEAFNLDREQLIWGLISTSRLHKLLAKQRASTSKLKSDFCQTFGVQQPKHNAFWEAIIISICWERISHNYYETTVAN